MKIGRSLFVFLASVFIIPFAAQTYMAGEEDCEHDWEFYVTNYYGEDNSTQHQKVEEYYCSKCGESNPNETLEKHTWEYDYSDKYTEISATQHSYEKKYRCDVCGASKTDTIKEAHKWVLWTKYYGETKSISAEQHSYESCYYCEDCAVFQYPEFTEKHQLDKYGLCENCEFIRTSTVTLKPNSTVNVNENTWMKVTAPKKGLLYLYITGETKDTIVILYNRKKVEYPNYWHQGDTNKVVIPVQKGTYYLKQDYTTNTVKYVFKADPSKKNYTKKKAISLKRNKTYTTVIYSGDKKSTWKRWYKIKLTKKQRILFNSDCGSLYDKKGNYLTQSSYYDKKGNLLGYITDRKLPKGTYYLYVGRSWTAKTRKQTTGEYYTIKWK